MAYQDCIAAIQKADPSLTEDEIAGLVEDLQTRQKILVATGEAATEFDAAMKAADIIGKQVELAASIKKRQDAENFLKMNAAMKQVEGFADPVIGLKSFLVGSNKFTLNARNSVMAAQIGLRNRYLSGFDADLLRAGVKDAWLHGDRDLKLETAKVVVAINKKQDLKGFSADAQKLGAIIQKWQEVARVGTNKAGGYVGKLDDYFMSQSHDPLRVRTYGGQNGDEWVKYMAENLDLQRMGIADAATAERMLREEYSQIIHRDHKTEMQGAGTTGLPSNLAKRVSAERVFHFKDTEAAFAYNEKFGRGDFTLAVIGGLERAARNTALMQKMGTNPEHFLDAMLEKLRVKHKDAPVEQTDRLRNAAEGFRTSLKHLDGRANQVGNESLANAGLILRTLENGKLGGMIFSQLSDISTFGAMARSNGGSMIQAMLARIGQGFARGSDEQKAFASSLGVYFDHFTSILHTQHVPEGGLPGWLAKGHTMFMRLTGGPRWQDASRSAAGYMLGNIGARNAAHDFANLPAGYRDQLQRYGITADDWEVMRTHGVKEFEGERYLLADNFGAVPDAALAPMVQGKIEAIQARKVSDEAKAAGIRRAYDQAREDLSAKLYNMYADQIGFMALEPDAQTKALMYGDTQRGTVRGEFWRTLLQFKSFTFAYTQKVLGTVLRADSIGEGVKNLATGRGDMATLAGLMAASTIFGYISMSLKDLSKGRTPRDITEQPYAVTLAALAQGGGAGIWGDFMFGETNRFNGGLAKTLLGPGFGDMVSIAELAQRSIHGDGKAADWVQEMYSKVPQLWYTRFIMDQMFMYRLYEAISPGHLARVESNMRQKQGTEFFLRPQI